MKQFPKKSMEYQALNYYWKLIQKDSKKLSLNTFYARTFKETLTPREYLCKIFKLVLELKPYYDLYQLLLFHLQEKNVKHFFDLIHDEISHLNHTFKTALNTFIRYTNYITNAIMPLNYPLFYEATNKLIKDIKHNTFGYRNFKKRIYIDLNITKEKTISSSPVLSYRSPHYS